MRTISWCCLPSTIIITHRVPLLDFSQNSVNIKLHTENGEFSAYSMVPALMLYGTHQTLSLNLVATKMLQCLCYTVYVSVVSYATITSPYPKPSDNADLLRTYSI